MAAFPPVSAQVSFPALEQIVLDRWKAQDTFKRSVSQRPESSQFIFYDGPPFATGLPHYGHLVASTLKDIVPRFWAMRGRRVERRFGWDTHGLPIEMLMEKQLGLSGPTSIREYGIDKFNEACRGGVLKYTAEWEKVIGRLGRWVDFEDDYKTMDPTFMESVWWVFKQLWDKGLVFEDFRVMPFSWRLSTPLSNFEAGSDYRDVQDPAITVTMPVLGEENLHLLVWTTTPWTLPSNLAVAVGEDIDYIKVKKTGDDRVFVIAEALAKSILGKKYEVVGTLKGADLVGLKYAPLFDYFADHPCSFEVITSGHVTTSSGTGLVHMAPDFGEEDFNACKKLGIKVLLSVDNEGNFVEAVTDFAGRNVKEADPDIIRRLKADGRLFRHDTIQHSYPFCWRSGTPLIYKAVPARFVRVTELRDRMVEHNASIHWVPGPVGHGRFNNWLKDARDWNISRNRFWGTPIPIWRCDRCGTETCIGSIAELEAKTGAEVTDLHPHRIDHLELDCECGQKQTLIGDVFDCWFESGAMPYAQGHYPFEDKDRFEANFPAEFIAEGLDQTRGWFYTLLVLSTALFDKPPFKNCIVNGMVLAEDGEKMSKSKQNYPPVGRVLDEYGADALRAYLINSPIVRAEPLRFNERGVREVARTVLLPLRNAWSFFVQYANIDGWDPATAERPPAAERPELDRWLLSVLQSLVREVNTQMEGYYLYRVVPPIVGFIDHLTNWYIRRSRRRFWRAASDPAGQADKAAAYATLYEALVTFSKVMAPMLPFITETLYQDLVVTPGCEGPDSVHLCDYPQPDESLIDSDLEAAVALTRQVVGLGRALRERHKLKTRQPLAKVTVVHHDPTARAALLAHAELIQAELNVKAIEVLEDAHTLAKVSFKANFKTLGRRFGKKMKIVAGRVAQITDAEWTELQAGGSLDIEGGSVTAEDVMVTREAIGDVVIQTEGAVTVALDTELNPALIEEGLAREITSRLQRARKDNGFEVTDRIAVTVTTRSAALLAALANQRDYVAAEVLATTLDLVDGEPGDDALDAEGHSVSLSLVRA